MPNLNVALTATLLASPLLLLGPLVTLLYRRGRMEKETPQGGKVPVPEGAQIKVSCTTTGGVSKHIELRSNDIRRDFRHHGEHWRYAQELGIHDFEDYWWHLLEDLGLNGEQRYLFKDSPVELDIKPMVDHQGSKQVLVSFRYSECTNPFREIILEVPEDKDMASERLWKQQTAHLRNGHGETVSVKIGDLDDADYEVFKMVMDYFQSTS
ncbi:MAG: hypothetical protein Q9199_007307 [Rusavskia elegans]